MEVPHEALLLRIFTSAADRCRNEVLYLAILHKAHDMHMAGATVLRGPLGYGHTRKMHAAHLFPPSDDHPVIIEIVDSEDKINEFLPVLDQMMQSGLVTLERARVLQYGKEKLGFMARVRQQFSHADHTHPQK